MRNILLLFYFTIVIVMSSRAQNVLTYHNDLNRTGWNNRETILNQKNVKAGSFGKIFSRTIDDQVYAQPLVMKVNIPGKGIKNIVFVATVNNSVYAFDADVASVDNAYWKINLSPAHSRPVRSTDMTEACNGHYRDFSGNIGIVGTPVIDSAANTLYLVARSLDTVTHTFEQYLHALDLSTGTEKPNSPKLITAQITGHGSGSINNTVYFDAQKQNQRCGLLLLDGIVYIAYAAHCDWGPYHGWVLGYDKTTLKQKKVYNTTPNGNNGGIWMSGGAPAADEEGNIYVSAGNGAVGIRGNPGDIVNRAESALKLTVSDTSLVVKSFFTPYNYIDLNSGDLDFGVTEILLIPGTNRAITGCKDGNLYVLNRDSMGGYTQGGNNVIQTINLGTNAHLRSALAYYKGAQKEFLYTWSENALLKAFPYSRATNKFDLPAAISSGIQGPVGNHGAFLTVSSNESVDSTAVLWASYALSGDASQAARHAVLRAFKANDVTKELWNSAQNAADDPGTFAKFICPVVANGKVYLATFSNKLEVYGLISNNNAADTCSSYNLAMNKPATASSQLSGHASTAAFDGNTATSWSSTYTDAQYVYVDLGKNYDLCKVALKWGAAIAKDFQIQLSADAVNWQTVLNKTNNTAAVNDLPVKGNGRYVRMSATASAMLNGYTLNEFEVYGKKTENNCWPPDSLTVADVQENTVTLHWNNNASEYNVQYKSVSADNWTQVTTSANSITINGLSCATDYIFQLQSICDQKDTSYFSPASSFSTLACSNTNCGFLPTRWTTQDIGDIKIAGSACYNNSQFQLTGSGDDIGNMQDAFRFAYKTWFGDGEIKARVVSLSSKDSISKCGIMFRENLTPGSANVFLGLTNSGEIIFQARTATNTYTTNIKTQTGIAKPYWIKIIKTGSVYTAFISPDNIDWYQLGNPIDAGFGEGGAVSEGLAVTNHNNDALAQAVIDNYLSSALPQISLQSFVANLLPDRTVALQWITNMEINIQSFILERSTDNIHYTTIDTATPVNKAAYTQIYNSKDITPQPGINYYRLRIINTDGTTSAATTSVMLPASSAPLLYPNPAYSTVHILQGTDQIKSILMYDISGRLITRINNVVTSIADIPVYTFANGIYIIKIITESGVYRQKLIIHN